MSNASPSKRSKAGPPSPRMTAEEEETLYFQDPNPKLASIDIDKFEVDRICTRCGHWKSEHPWDTCATPNWL
jgi:hypothetical protein